MEEIRIPPKQVLEGFPLVASIGLIGPYWMLKQTQFGLRYQDSGYTKPPGRPQIRGKTLVPFCLSQSIAAWYFGFVEIRVPTEGLQINDQALAPKGHARAQSCSIPNAGCPQNGGGNIKHLRPGRSHQSSSNAEQTFATSIPRNST